LVFDRVALAKELVEALMLSTFGRTLADPGIFPGRSIFVDELQDPVIVVEMLDPSAIRSRIYGDRGSPRRTAI